MTLPLQQLISDKKCRCAEPSAVMVVSTFSPPPSIRRELVGNQCVERMFACIVIYIGCALWRSLFWPNTNIKNEIYLTNKYY